MSGRFIIKITLLVLYFFASIAMASGKLKIPSPIPTPPAPIYINAPASSTGSFTISWGMPSDDNSSALRFSTASKDTKQANLVAVKAENACLGDCTNTYDYEFSLEQSKNSGSYIQVYSGQAFYFNVSSSAPGNYRYRVKVRNRSGLSSSAYSSYTYSGTVNVALSTTPKSVTEVSNAPVSSLSGELPSNEYNNVQLKGNVTIDGGAFSYQLPIALPPGRNKMTPNVALSYSSQSGVGIAGFGWSLSASGSVSRCSSSFSIDGYSKNVTFSTADKLCLNGRRLINISGSYGYSGTRYKTEIDSGVIIEQKGGSSTSSYAYFKVTHKSGQISYYGDNSNSRFAPIGASSTLRWHKRKDIDQFDNNIIYSYADESGNLLLDTIHYTGTGDSTGNRSITFDYVELETPTHGYIWGHKYTSAHQLSGIDISVPYNSGKDTGRYYKLDYDDQHLTGLRLCSSSSCGTTLAETSFQWFETELDYSEQASHPLDYIDNTDSELLARAPYELSADYDGDGINDAETIDKEIFLSNGTTQKIDMNSLPSYSHTLAQNNELYYNKVIGNIDYNGDGRSDFIYTDTNHNLKIAQWNGGNSFSTLLNTGISAKCALRDEKHMLGHNLCRSFLFDVNGDGYQDIISSTSANKHASYKFSVYLRNRNSTNIATSGFAYAGQFEWFDIQFSMSMADINGDGQVDLYSTRQAKWLKFSFNNNQLTLTKYDLAIDDDLGVSIRDKTTVWLDTNGDGLLDPMVLKRISSSNPQLNWHVAINKGNGLFATPVNTGIQEFITAGGGSRNGTPPDESATLSRFVQNFDYNGDGRTDLLVPNNQRYRYDCWNLSSNEACGAVDESPPTIDPRFYTYDIWQWKVLQADADGVGFTETLLAEDILGALATTSIVDFNGDGSQDIVTAFGWESYQGTSLHCGPGNHNASGKLYCYPSHAPTPGVYVYEHKVNNNHLIESVDDGFGKAFTVNYKSLAHNFNENNALYTIDMGAMPDRRYSKVGSNMKVVQSVEQRNGVGGFNTTDYFYEDGIYHTQGRGFQGFGAIIEKNRENGLTTRTEYEQAFPRSGMINRQETYRESDSRPISLYEVLEFSDEWCTSLESGIYGPHAFSTRIKQYELRTGAQTSSSTSKNYYSCRGTKRNAHTDTTDAIQRQQKLVVNTLTTGVNSFVERVTESTVTDSTKYLGWSAWAPGNSTTTKRVRYSDFYNEKARKTEQCGAVSTSASTTISAFSCGYGSDLTLVQQLILDGYGNATRLTSSSTGTAGSYTDIQGSRWVQTQYESEGYFPYRTFNSQWGTSIVANETLVDKLLGKAISVKDVAGIIQQIEYDKLGREISLSVKKGSSRVAPTQYKAYRTCDYYEGCPSLASYSVTQVQDGAPSSVSYFDANHRVIQSKIRGFTGNWVYNSTRYGARGQVLNETRANNNAVGAVTTTYSQHDALGRVGTKVIDNYPAEYTTRYTYNGLTTNITVTPNRYTAGGVTAFSVSRTYNSFKQLIRTTDANNQRSYFAYWANANPSVIKDAKGQLIKANYNGLGHKTSVDDPNMGYWQYRYNALGELRYQKDATNVTSVFNYDKIGRKTSQVVGSETQRWYYDSDAGYGKLRYDTRNGNNSYSRYYNYDTQGRVTKQTLNANSQAIVTETAFDSHYGRVKAQGYGGQFAIIEHQYNKYGYPTADIDTKTGKKLVNRTRYNAMGSVTEQQFSNKLIQTFNYANNLTQVNSVCTNTSTSCSAGLETQAQYYYYDAFGNVTRRNDTAGGRDESYQYDLLQRVKKATVSVAGLTVPIDYNYDAVGNLTKKGDYASLYRYGNAARTAGGNAGPNAVRELTLLNGSKANLSYDNNGNLKTSTNGNLAISYNAAMKPRNISRNGQNLSFKYDANEQRFLQVKGSGSSQITKYYVGNYELEIKANGTRIQKAYIGKHSIISDEKNKPRVVHSSVDRLGSVTSLTNGDKSLDNTNQTDLLIQRRAYDVFGRAFDAYNNNQLAVLSTTPRGFTGHEHLPEVGLIHMNGRGFDPLLGRFLSVDPFIQAPGNTQSINPYTYIFNNPLSGTDPTGYVSKEIDEINGGVVTENQNEDEVAVENGQENEKVRIKDNRSGNKTGIMVSKSAIRDAVISQHVYDGQGCLKCVGVSKLNDKQLLDKGILPGAMNDIESGFKSGLYQDENSGDYVYAFAGTEELAGSDMAANFSEGLGRFSMQHSLAVKNTAMIMNKLGEIRLSVTGHSLGGGLASLAAQSQNIKANTFNAAGLSLNTYLRYGIGYKSQSNINSYHIEGEILTYLQKKSGFPKALGNRIQLPAKDKLRKYFNVGQRNERHGISYVNEILGSN